MSRSGVPPLGRILVGDVRSQLTELPDAAVDTVITSPPYWAMRDYGHDGQIGAEPIVEAWAEQIADVAIELSRVLTPTGGLWLNLGDGYSRHPREGAAKKGLLLGPERVAAKLTRNGWLLRNKVIWAKSNPMPFRGSDRLTTTHEYLYFFAKQLHYYFDLDAIRGRAASAGQSHRAQRASYPPRDAVPALGGGSSPRIDLNQGLAGMKAGGRESHPLGKNPGDVWIIPTASYHGAHFATFRSNSSVVRCSQPVPSESALSVAGSGNGHRNGLTAGCSQPDRSERPADMMAGGRAESLIRSWAPAPSPSRPNSTAGIGSESS